MSAKIVYMPLAILAPIFVPNNWRGKNSGWEIAATQSTNHESSEKRPSLVGLPKMAVLAWGPICMGGPWDSVLLACETHLSWEDANDCGMQLDLTGKFQEEL